MRFHRVFSGLRLGGGTLFLFRAPDIRGHAATRTTRTTRARTLHKWMMPRSTAGKRAREICDIAVLAGCAVSCKKYPLTPRRIVCRCPRKKNRKGRCRLINFKLVSRFYSRIRRHERILMENFLFLFTKTNIWTSSSRRVISLMEFLIN